VRLCLACGAGIHGDDWTCPECGQSPARNEFLSFAPELDAGNEFIEADSFERLARLEGGSFWFRARSELIVWAVRRYAQSASSFLEVGCGTGFVMHGLHKAFPSMALTGAEIHGDALRFTRHRVPGAELLQMDARRIPFDSEFDAAGAFDVIEHIDEDAEVLAQMGQAVRPGGLVLASVPQHRWLWSAADDFAHHRRRYRRGEIRRKAEEAGLEVEAVISFVSVLLPLLLASRVRQRGNLESYDPSGELRFSRSLDRSLEAAMSLERWLIKRSLRFPAGASALMVARRPSDS
jgi:SAM-dependent methyltransferase